MLLLLLLLLVAVLCCAAWCSAERLACVALRCTLQVVSVLHMVFDFLAFKNDIAFWCVARSSGSVDALSHNALCVVCRKENKSLEGLSVRTIFLNTGCQFVIFLYLLDNETSFMILMSSGIGLVIEVRDGQRLCSALLGSA
jgi:hypothetical protein